MMDFIETILVKIFSLLPDADPNNSVVTTVTTAFTDVHPTFYKLNLIFPISTLFAILLLVIFVELSLLLIKMVMKVGIFFRG